PSPAAAVVRGPRHDLPRDLRALLESRPEGLRAKCRGAHARRGVVADAARALRLPDRPTLDLHAPCHLERAGQRLAGLSLPPRRRILGRPHRTGGHVLDVLVLVRGVLVASRRPAQGPLLLREDARIRQPPGPLRRGAGAAGTASRQLPAGLHPSGADQRGLRSRPAALGRWPRRMMRGSRPTGVFAALAISSRRATPPSAAASPRTHVASGTGSAGDRTCPIASGAPCARTTRPTGRAGTTSSTTSR